jgi:hypothetical protein
MAFFIFIGDYVDSKEKLAIIESVLKDVAGRESCYPDGDIADEIIKRVRDLTGDTTFCGPQTASLEERLISFEMRVETWENDADNYRTKVLNGLTQADVRFFADVCKAFRSCHARVDTGMGNEEVNYYVLPEVIYDITKNHQDVSDAVKTKWLFAELTALDIDNENEDPNGEQMKSVGQSLYKVLIENLLSYPVEYDYGWCRVVDKDLSNSLY